jgi:AcrR family transcriptional regulator
MTQDENRRNVMTDRLADHILAHGLISSSLRPLAKAVGTSDRMLLYYFTDKADLLAATLGRIVERMMQILVARTTQEQLPFDLLLQRVSEITLDAEFWPYMAVWLELASRAARGDAIYHPIAEQIGRGFLGWIEMQLASAQDTDRQQEAARLLVQIEGLVVVKAIGLGDVALNSLIARP